MGKLSSIFEGAFATGSGGIVRDCACGKTHFSNASCDEGCYEKGELENLLKRCAENPSKYQARDCTVSTMTISGEEYVYGCDCEEPNKAELFVRDNAVSIARFLRELAKKHRAYADKLAVPS